MTNQAPGYEEALQAVQSATSVKSILAYMGPLMMQICEMSRNEGASTLDRNQHPEIRNAIKRLKAMMEIDIDQAYGTVLSRAKESAKKEGGQCMYDKYWAAMDACNLSGVLFSCVRDLNQIEEVCVADDGKSELAYSPVIAILVDKFEQLAFAG